VSTRYPWQAYSPGCPLSASSVHRFEIDGLLADLARIREVYGLGGPARFDQRGWSAIALHGRHGDVLDDEVAEDPRDYRETEAWRLAPHLAGVLERLRSEGCALQRVRLSILQPRELISWHWDSRRYRLRPGEDNELRLHIPLITSAAVCFRIGPERLCMHPGELWLCEVAFPHQVYNGGDGVRVQLLADCRAPWSFVAAHFPALAGARADEDTRARLSDYHERARRDVSEYRLRFGECEDDRLEYERSEFLP
jgi:hypothetical protein